MGLFTGILLAPLAPVRGTIWLAEQLAEQAARESDDAVVEEPRTEYELMRASYLVERRKIAAFDARMDELARNERDRIDFAYTGPLPPHSFVSLTPRRT